MNAAQAADRKARRRAALERAARAQACLERAARLEGTGQPVLCQVYVRRAGDLIAEGRELMAWARGGFAPFVLAAERLGFTAAPSFRSMAEFHKAVTS